MFLASKMRAAASRGELDRLEIDPALAARKDEFIAMQARQPQELDAFFARITEQLRGKRVFMIGTYSLMYDIAKAGLERGIARCSRKDSAILTGGGMKGVVLPDDFMDVITEFLGVDRIQEGYGFSEPSTFHWACRKVATTCSRGSSRSSSIPTPVSRCRAPAGRPAAPPSTTFCSGTLGRRHFRRRGDHRLGSGVSLRPDQRRVRERHHALQREAGR